MMPILNFIKIIFALNSRIFIILKDEISGWCRGYDAPSVFTPFSKSAIFPYL